MVVFQMVVRPMAKAKMAPVVPLGNSLAYIKFTARSCSSVFLIIFVLLIGDGVSRAADRAVWGDLSSWIGRYPTDREGKSTRHLLEEPEIRKTLQGTLPSDHLRQLTSLTEEKP